MSSSTTADSSRRSFLKIGAGVVGGVVVGAVGVAAYESSVIGANSSSSSSTVASLQSQLTATQSQLNTTVGSLNAANNTISSLNGQLTSAQSALSGAQGSLAAANSQNATLTAQNTSLNSQLTATQSSLTSANGQVTSLQGQLSSASSQVSSLQTQVDMNTGFLYLSATEQSLLSAVTSAIIPTDSNGPGAAQAGVVYFIDRQLASDYGSSGTMYMQGPYVMSGAAGPITVGGITYPNGAPAHGLEAGTRYQYSFDLRFFWHAGLAALQSYSSSAYGSNFEQLSSAKQSQVLTDLWNNKPTSFNAILPLDFAWELFFVTWCGFLTDPLYGGNRNMIGWKYTGFNGINTGNFYGEGMTPKQLMVATTPTRLQPASLAQLQKGSA